MRLLCWNIRDLLGDPLALHRVVRAADADVACFQEAPRRPGATLRLGMLARGTGLRCVAGGRRSGGTAIFVAPHVTVRWARTFRLPVARWWSRTRGASVAEVCIAGRPSILVASVHLPLHADSRVAHVDLVGRVLAGRARPTVVAADMNEAPGGPAWAAWAPWLTDPRPDAGATFPARGPHTRIDAVLTSPGLQVLAYAITGSSADVVRASDHLPILTVIDAGDPVGTPR